MKIVLLPGMDGTGKLFSALLPHLDGDAVQIVPLPNHGAQDYDALTEYVESALPREDYILVAESFSGPIAVRLASEGHIGMKGLVLVATFLSPPNKLLLRLAEILPIKALMKLPFASLIVRALMLGFESSKGDVINLRAVIDEVPISILRQRLQAMRSLSVSRKSISMSSVYIRPTLDRLVSSRKVIEMHEYISSLVVRRVKGPHFVLQAKPCECASIINSMQEIACLDNKTTHKIAGVTMKS